MYAAFRSEERVNSCQSVCVCVCVCVCLYYLTLSRKQQFSVTPSAESIIKQYKSKGNTCISTTFCFFLTLLVLVFCDNMLLKLCTVT